MGAYGEMDFLISEYPMSMEEQLNDLISKHGINDIYKFVKEKLDAHKSQKLINGAKKRIKAYNRRYKSLDPFTDLINQITHMSETKYKVDYHVNHTWSLKIQSDVDVEINIIINFTNPDREPEWTMYSDEIFGELTEDRDDLSIELIREFKGFELDYDDETDYEKISTFRDFLLVLMLSDYSDYDAASYRLTGKYENCPKDIWK